VGVVGQGGGERQRPEIEEVRATAGPAVAGGTAGRRGRRLGRGRHASDGLGWRGGVGDHGQGWRHKQNEE
jgi:hypothetical protein